MTALPPAPGTDIEADFRAFRARADADPRVLALVLMGSRGYGAEIAEDSDYDVLVVVDGDPAAWQTEHGSSVEAWAMTLGRFRGQGLPGSPDSWNRPAFLGVKVLLDRLDGEIERLVEAKRTLGHEEARELAASSLDGYINSLYRSLRNLEAGRTLEGRLDALESIGPLLTAVFALEGRVRPFNKWLRHELRVRPLNFGDLADLADLADGLSSDQAPDIQRAAFRRVEVDARTAGYGWVLDGWAPDVEWLRGSSVASRGMRASDVVELLERLEAVGIDVWIDGGWAVDANIGHQTRSHADLDVFIEKGDLDTLVAELSAQGFAEVPRDDTRPWNFVLGNADGREIDLHVIDLGGDGRFRHGLTEAPEVFPIEALAGRGSIGGRSVRCTSPEWLVRWHDGYELDANDRDDVVALCEAFSIAVPERFAKTSGV